MSSMTVTVTGMTCGHCVSAVRDEIGGIDGVTGVDVDLESGSVVIEADREIDPAAVEGAVHEAGYTIGAR